MTGITDHLLDIRQRVEGAAARSGRNAADITLVAVSKGQPLATVRSGLDAGLEHFGENYLQEALPKIAALGAAPRWHFIGTIQANKTREIAAGFAWAQTVVSARIATRLSAQRPHHAEPLQVCIQLTPGEGGARHGCPPEQVAPLADLIGELPGLRLRGLMLLPRAGRLRDQLREDYRGGRLLLEQLHGRGHRLDTLSMGMSDDFVTAIEEGSTMIRVGTGVFGQRT